MNGPNPQGDPGAAARAWARFRRLMRAMMALTVLVVAAALAAIHYGWGAVSIHLYIATALGIGFTMLLTSALMGLVFLSSRSGHDDAVVDPVEDKD